MPKGSHLATLNRSRRIDLTGRKFSMLTVIKTDGKKGFKYTYECLCDCGEIRRNVCGDNLTRGKTKNCGCAFSDSYCPPIKNESEYFERIKAILLKRRVINDECWEYTGQRNHFNYGIKSFGRGTSKKKIRVHRISFMLWKGEIPKGMFVLHTCDNPICFNPDHLKLGTHMDNMRDKKERNRNAAACSKHPRLTKDKVIEIRNELNSGKSIKDISIKYNASIETIEEIKLFKRWKNI